MPTLPFDHGWREPADDLNAVIQLLVQIFIDQNSLGIAGTTGIDAGIGDAVLREFMSPQIIDRSG